MLDINLRSERSFEFAEALLRDGVPFVFRSGYLEADLPEAFQGRPMMTKPVDVAGLSRCIDALVLPR